MTDQKTDQAALNGLVDEFGWEWRQWDIYLCEKDKTPHAYVIAIKGQEKAVQMQYRYNKYYPLAGTWVEGRLRELMGEAFRGLKHNYFLNDSKGGYICSFWVKSRDENPDQAFGDTPITALVAALRVLKQKEVSGERKRDS